MPPLPRMHGLYRAVCAAFFLLPALTCAGCHMDSPSGPPPSKGFPLRDINEVLRDHDQELMAIPGIVGVYVGLLEDGQTPCLKVMAVKKTPELERKVPKSLEGHPVLIEETGVIRPLPKK